MKTKQQCGPSPTRQGIPGLGSACLTYTCEGAESRPHRSLQDPVAALAGLPELPGTTQCSPWGLLELNTQLRSIASVMPRKEMS